MLTLEKLFEWDEVARKKKKEENEQKKRFKKKSKVEVVEVIEEAPEERDKTYVAVEQFFKY